MGCKVADATKACRIRRIRGETGRLCFFTTATWAVPVFLALPVCFGLAGADFSGVAGAVTSWLVFGEAAGACFSGLSEAEELPACGDWASESVPPGSTHSTSTHDHSRPNRTTFVFYLSRGDANTRTRIRELQSEPQPLKLLARLAEACAHHCEIVFSQAAHDFLLKIIATGGSCASVALLKSVAALFDVGLQAIVKIFVATSFIHFSLVV